jgi:hypothetical protein
MNIRVHGSDRFDSACYCVVGITVSLFIAMNELHAGIMHFFNICLIEKWSLQLDLSYLK